MIVPIVVGAMPVVVLPITVAIPAPIVVVADNVVRVIVVDVHLAIPVVDEVISIADVRAVSNVRVIADSAIRAIWPVGSVARSGPAFATSALTRTFGPIRPVSSVWPG